jgi:hypothetical protein
MAFLADMLEDVNQELNDPHASIGPSHFLLKDTRTFTEDKAELIWNHSILPALADRFFDTPGELERFAYQRVRSRTTPDESPRVPPVAPETDDDDNAPTDTQ